jgi:hypothetical protein
VSRLVRINKLLWLGTWSDYGSMPPLGDSFFSLPSCKHVKGKSCLSWILRWLQERMVQTKGHRCKMEAGMSSFSLVFS